MVFLESQNLYEVLDIVPDASPQAIREAYSRMRHAYKKDNVALYSLISAEECDKILKNIEIAFTILSVPERRKNYDQSHGFIQSSKLEETASQAAESEASDVISIDRVPPMELASPSTEDLLIPPCTEINDNNYYKSASPSFESTDFERNPFKFLQESHNVTEKKAHLLQNVVAGYSQFSALRGTHFSVSANSEIKAMIDAENDWRGNSIRQIREAYKISIEELSDITKLSKAYLHAIEEENFVRLPAPVYVRGFVIQIAKALKLPSDKVSSAYLSRFLNYHDEHQKSSKTSLKSSNG